MINIIMCGVEESLYKTTAILMDHKTLHTFWKNPNVANNNYKIQFDTYVNVLVAYTSESNILPDFVDGNLRELYPSLSDPNNALSRQHEAETEATKE